MEWFREYFSEIVCVAGISAIAGALVWIGGKMVWIGRKMEVLKNIQKDLRKIKSNLKVVSDTMISNSSIDFDHTKLTSMSPLQLTNGGEKFISKLGFDKVFKEHKDDFFQFIESECPKNDYDIEIAAQKSIIVLFGNDYFGKVKEYLYNNPKVNKHHVKMTLGVYVRDKFKEFKENKTVN